MKTCTAVICSLWLAGVLYSGPAAAHGVGPDGRVARHGGGLHDLGCHHNRQAGGYHCHRGPLEGLSFASKDEAIAYCHSIGCAPSSDPPPPPPPPPEERCLVTGFAAVVTHVRDGDTIVVGELPIRLQGIAAPESNQRGGPRATRAMENLVFGREVWCDLDGESTFDRCSAICYIGVRDVGAVMVRRGLARDCARFSRGRYERLELQAFAEGALIRRFYQLPGYCRR